MSEKKGFFTDGELFTWREEWEGMPEYQRYDNKPFQRIVINFKTKEAVKEFAELVGQQLTFKTNTIWFPKQKRRDRGIYIDES